MSITIRIPRNGLLTGNAAVRAIHSTAAASLLQSLGSLQTRRASHVEPGEGLREVAKLWLREAAKSREDIAKTLQPDGELKDQYKIMWWSDLLPVGGPVLGPFETNTEALSCEISWLTDNKIPIPG